MIKTLQYFVKYDRQDVVQIGVVVSGIDGLLPTESVIPGSDAALQAASGSTNWDEDTICTAHGLVRASLPEPLAAAVAA